ncbi:alpha-galactosidase A [Geopyxis carbonaria]|nr:alpha-galactosidase A [Geopyxis carbonaria]
MEVSRGDVQKSYYRILIGDKVKYLEVSPGIYGEETLRRPPDLLASLPTLPYSESNWMTAKIRGTSWSDVEVMSRQPAAVGCLWHPARFDVLSLSIVQRLSDRAYEVTHPSQGGSMIAKYARFEFEIPRIQTETHIYRTINDHGIAPEFLGHIHEHGRIIGFLLRKISGGRQPQPEDFDMCRDALEKLHSLRVGHVDLRRDDFIIKAWNTHQSEAVIIDFEKSTLNSRTEELEWEMSRLPKVLNPQL